MIKFFRQAKREILIEFDKGGCDELLSLFSKIKKTQIEKLAKKVKRLEQNQKDLSKYFVLGILLVVLGLLLLLL